MPHVRNGDATIPAAIHARGVVLVDVKHRVQPMVVDILVLEIVAGTAIMYAVIPATMTVLEPVRGSYCFNFGNGEGKNSSPFRTITSKKIK